MTVKYFLLATGLQNITGSKKVIEIINKLGHCLDYNTTCEIETAQAKTMQVLGGSINSTHLVAFQEQDNNVSPVADTVALERNKQRQFEFNNSQVSVPR